MNNASYIDLDLLLTQADSGFEARIVRSPVGDGQAAAFGPLFSDLEVENFELKVSRGRTRTRRVDAGPVADVKRFGGRLFDAVFAGETRECLRRSQDFARDHQAALRIRLRLADCPELANLPWEFLYDVSEDAFLALSVATPVVRYLQLPAPPRPVSVTLPLQVLVIRSEPADLPELRLDEEWAQVTSSMQDLVDTGAVEFTSLAMPSLSELRRVLMRGQFHVLHYMGHGSFDPENGGLLYFTGPDRRAVAVSATDLGVMMRDHLSMRLAVLNACEGARTDPDDPFAGVAETLVRRGVPAVVAMQFEFTDQAAVEFAPALYGALAAGLPVDAAVTEARKAVYAVSQVEWATPVLHMRAQDATLFTVTESRPSDAAPAGAATRPQKERIYQPSLPDTPSAKPDNPAMDTGMISIRRRANEWVAGARRFSVLVDGNVLGRLIIGQTRSFNVRPGSHRLQLVLNRFESDEVSFTVAVGETVSFVCGIPIKAGDFDRSLMKQGEYHIELLREYSAAPPPGQDSAPPG